MLPECFFKGSAGRFLCGSFRGFFASEVQRLTVKDIDGQIEFLLDPLETFKMNAEAVKNVTKQDSI